MPKAGDTRNVDYEGVLKPEGTMDQFDGKIWRSVSTPEGKAAHALRGEQGVAQRAQDTATSRAGLDRQRAFFANERAEREGSMAPASSSSYEQEIAALRSERAHGAGSTGTRRSGVIRVNGWPAARRLSRSRLRSAPDCRHT